MPVTSSSTNSLSLPAIAKPQSATKKKNISLTYPGMQASQKLLFQGLFCHRNPEKSAGKMFSKALALNPRTIVFYMDILMNSLTSPPWRSHAPLLTPEEVLRKLFVLERKANAKDCNFVSVSVLCSAKNHTEKIYHHLLSGTLSRNQENYTVLTTN